MHAICARVQPFFDSHGGASEVVYNDGLPANQFTSTTKDITLMATTPAGTVNDLELPVKPL